MNHKDTTHAAKKKALQLSGAAMLCFMNDGLKFNGRSY
jgi:hypothetical protein